MTRASRAKRGAGTVSIQTVMTMLRPAGSKCSLFEFPSRLYLAGKVLILRLALSDGNRFVATFEAQCNQMETLVQRMDMLMGRFNETVEYLGVLRPEATVPVFRSQDTGQMQSPQPHLVEGTIQMDQVGMDDNFLFSDDAAVPVPQVTTAKETVEDNDDEESEENSEDELEQNNAIDHVMTTDSYGKLRLEIL